MSTEEFDLDDVQQSIVDTIENTKDNVFVHGMAGSGKSYIINYIKKHSCKRMAIVAPTALAAMLIGGSTIHSFFSLPISDFMQRKDLFKTNRDKLRLILKHLDLLIIDEVSMVNPNVLSAINIVLQTLKGNMHPFGGLQVALFGDMCQLPPVIKYDIRKLYAEKYGCANPFFFDSEAYKDGNFKHYELREIYRQEDTELLQYLKCLRTGKNINLALNYFNTNYVNEKDLWKDAITITPYKAVASEINEAKLKAIKEPLFKYKALKTGVCTKIKEFPAPDELKLKKGALVMFTKNNPGCWVNGSMGIVESVSKYSIMVRKLEDNTVQAVGLESWKSYKYDIDKKTGHITQKEVGEFIQYPLQLGYGLTINKAQGKTLDKVIIDMGKGAFAHGQTYVALSRTRCKEDIQLRSYLDDKDIIIDQRISNFLESL